MDEASPEVEVVVVEEEVEEEVVEPAMKKGVSMIALQHCAELRHA